MDFSKYYDTPLKEASFSVLDFETTGTRPSSSRVIEVGIAKVENLKIVDSFQSLINPGSLIPPFISELTGISDNDVKNAPEFSSISQNVKEFLEDTILVGHNLRFDYSFLEAEFNSAETLLPDLPQICTLKLARKVYPNLKSKALGNLTKSLKIMHKDAHRALGDATVTAKILIKIIKKLIEEYELETVSDLINFESIPTGGKSFRVIKKKLAEDFRNLSESPGIYLFRDSKDKIIYIGKAKSLKNRVKNYFSSSASRKAKRIVRKANRLEFKEMKSELTALISEAELIKFHKPELNTLLKKFSQNYFIRVRNTHDYPDVKVTTNFDFDGDDYFGPYNNRITANHLKEIIDKTFELRECTDKEFKKRRKCYLLDIKRCFGPCENDINETYSSELEKVYEFLSGKNQFAVDRLLNKMKSYSERQKYEEAAETRDTVNLILNQLNKSSILAEPINNTNSLIEIRDTSKTDYLLLIEGKVFLRDYFFDKSNLFEDALDDYFRGTIHLFPGIADKDLEKIKISLSWLVKNRTRVKIHYLKNFVSKNDLFSNLKFPIH